MPAAVPLLVQSSRPTTPSSAEKNNAPFELTRFCGVEAVLPLRMSFTSVVPAPVPLLVHNSTPFTPSSAVK